MEAGSYKPTINPSWTLFLDRDGVINVESVGSYITNWEEFQFHDGVLEAMRLLSQVFGRIVVVSNQRGVGRGIMTLDTLREIHANMQSAIKRHGGRIDKIYAATAVSDEDHNRKPNTGMALQAQQDFPEIDFRKSVMIGNSMSDMEFGKRLSMYTVLLTSKLEPVAMPNDIVDAQYSALIDWAATAVAAEPVQHG